MQAINPLNKDHYEAIRSVLAAEPEVTRYLEKVAAIIPGGDAPLKQFQAQVAFCRGCLEHFPPPSEI